MTVSSPPPASVTPAMRQYFDAKARYRELNPHDPDGLDLESWAAFEESHPGVFASMYQFSAQKPG